MKTINVIDIDFDGELICNYISMIFNTQGIHFNAIVVIIEIEYVFGISLIKAFKYYEKWAK